MGKKEYKVDKDTVDGLYRVVNEANKIAAITAIANYIEREVKEAEERGRIEALEEVLLKGRRYLVDVSPRVGALMCDEKAYRYGWEDALKNIKRDLSELKKGGSSLNSDTLGRWWGDKSELKHIEAQWKRTK